jgi:hypothetical protein
MVRYTTRPEVADENAQLVERVYEELAQADPGGLRYATFRLADGVTFVHLAIVEGDSNPLDRTAAFKEFVRDIGSRAVDGPTTFRASLVGSYRFAASADRP